jgi:hypothetical protein
VWIEAIDREQGVLIRTAPDQPRVDVKH